MNKLRAGLSKNPTFYSAVGMIAVLTLLSRVFGFARWITQSAFVGSGSMANAYASANQVPNIVFEMVAGGALAGLAIPLLAAPLAKTIKDEANQVASALLTWTIIILVPLAVVILGFLTALLGSCRPQLVQMYTPKMPWPGFS